jgi:hypothetical protein
VAASQARTWDAVIDLFAERNIPIRTMERASGFIATEQLSVNAEEGLRWADCGKAKWPFGGKRRDKEGKEVDYSRIAPDQAIYNVLVRGDSAESRVKVTVLWQYAGINGRRAVECSTKGVWEWEMESTIQQRAETRAPSGVTAQGPLDNVPPGTNWVADAKARLYYPARCPAASQVAVSDRLFYGSETAVQSAGFRRSPRC